MTAFQYSNALSLQSKIDHLNEVIVDRDTLITQLARAITAIEPSVASEGSWVAKARMGLAKTGFGVGVVNDKIYVIGGHPYGSTQVTIDDASVYDPATDEWHSKQPMPGPLAWFGTAIYQDKIYVIGGLAPNGTSRTRVNLNQIYDPATGTWSLGSPLPNAQKSISAGATIGVMAAKRIYVVGDGLNQVYDPANDSWTVAEPIPDSANRLTNFDDAEIAVVNDQLYALGGVYKDENGNVYSVNEQYTPIGYGTPEQFPQSPSPEP